MIYRHYPILVIIGMPLLLTSCSHAGRTPMLPRNVSAGQAAHIGMKKLQKGQYQQARQYFNVGLRENIRDCSLNFLNGLSYQLEGRYNNLALFNEALAGYNSAIRFCPNEPWSYYYSGIIFFQKKDYITADRFFKKAYRLLKHSKNSLTSTFFRAYLTSAYRSGDVQGGREAIAALSKLKPKNKLVKDLKSFYSSLRTPSKKMRKRLIVRKKPKTKFRNRVKQCIIDGVVLSSNETRNEQRGLNLLNGLKFSFGSATDQNSASYTTTITNDGTTPSVNSFTNVFTNVLRYSTLDYDLDIFNDYDELDEILARPSLVVKDGEEGKFFSGRKLILGLSGSESSDIEEFPLGTYLDVTPTFTGDNSINLKIRIGRDTLAKLDTSADVWSGIAQTTKQTIDTDINLHYNQTVILSTMAINKANNTTDKTPVLGDIPIVNLAFNKRNKLMRQGTLLFLITPRRFNSFYTTFHAPSESNLYHYYTKLISPNSNFKYILNKLRILDIYHFPERLSPHLYDKITFNRAVTHEFDNSVYSSPMLSLPKPN